MVGLKPTWGPVPYTGCISLEATIDYAGPHGQNCPRLRHFARSNSRERRDRRPPTLQLGAQNCEIRGGNPKALANPTEKPLAGMKIGVLKEGFEDPMTDPNIAAASLSAIAQMGELGAEIKEISIPLHRDSGMIWMVALPYGGHYAGLLANPAGRKPLLFPERATQVGPKLAQEAFDAQALADRISICEACYCKSVSGVLCMPAYQFTAQTQRFVRGCIERGECARYADDYFPSSQDYG